MANIWGVICYSQIGICRHTDGLGRYLIGIMNSCRELVLKAPFGQALWLSFVIIQLVIRGLLSAWSLRAFVYSGPTSASFLRYFHINVTPSCYIELPQSRIWCGSRMRCQVFVRAPRPMSHLRLLETDQLTTAQTQFIMLQRICTQD